jgi:hypothetical protein
LYTPDSWKAYNPTVTRDRCRGRGRMGDVVLLVSLHYNRRKGKKTMLITP